MNASSATVVTPAKRAGSTSHPDGHGVTPASDRYAFVGGATIGDQRPTFAPEPLDAAWPEATVACAWDWARNVDTCAWISFG